MSKFRSRSSGHPARLLPWAAGPGERRDGDASRVFGAALRAPSPRRRRWRARRQGQHPAARQTSASPAPDACSQPGSI